jgi:hypothetical protein
MGRRRAAGHTRRGAAGGAGRRRGAGADWTAALGAINEGALVEEHPMTELPVVGLGMTPDEIRIAEALSGCSFVPGSNGLLRSGLWFGDSRETHRWWLPDIELD